MFFLARSVFCIGLVAFMLPASQGPKSWRGLVESAQGVASDRLEALCSAAATECAEAKLAKLVLAGSLGGGSSSAASRKSVSTLVASDLIPVWKGPPPRS